MIKFFVAKQKHYTDIEVVLGLQGKENHIERWFYESAKRYFNSCFNEVFFDKDRRQEIFQSAFIKLWIEIDNGRICVSDNKLCRQQRNGLYEPMSCNLNTFLMAFARTEYRELVRNVRESYYDEVFEDMNNESTYTAVFDSDDDVDELKNRIVDECIEGMSPSCVEILTLFYYQGRSLDEIMEIRNESNSSKNGLKTAKNKCMNTLKTRIAEEFKRCNIYI